jgi:hypothetical protein
MKKSIVLLLCGAQVIFFNVRAADENPFNQAPQQEETNKQEFEQQDPNQADKSNVNESNDIKKPTEPSNLSFWKSLFYSKWIGSLDKDILVTKNDGQRFEPSVTWEAEGHKNGSILTSAVIKGTGEYVNIHEMILNFEMFSEKFSKQLPDGTNVMHIPAGTIIQRDEISYEKLTAWGILIAGALGCTVLYRNGSINFTSVTK